MAANIDANLANWSTTDSSNQPDGTDPADIDADLRRLQATVRKYTRTIGANIASGATVDLATASGDYVTVTGNTTITSFGAVSAGMRFWLSFTGTPILTHNGTSLILPSSANIQVVAGDTCCMESLGSGNWKCLIYQPIVGGFLNAAQAGANNDITSLSACTTITNVESISGLTTPLSVAQGGTDANNAHAARSNLLTALSLAVNMTGNVAATASDAGTHYYSDGTAARTLTLPAISSCPGACFSAGSPGQYNVTVAKTGADTIVGTTSAGGYFGDVLYINNGTDTWYTLRGHRADYAPASKSSPNIVKFGSLNVPQNATRYLTPLGGTAAAARTTVEHVCT